MKLARFRFKETVTTERETCSREVWGQTPDKKKAPAGEDRRALLASEGA